MRKQLIAFIAAILITGTVALSMFVVGANALANQNGTVASNSPSSQVTVATTGSPTTSSDQAQIAQLQSLVAQYQSREQQYQTALNTDNTQLTQAASEMQTIQQLLAYLESRGIIQIDSQGQITVLTRGYGN
jgi:biopolymer transport protein ExbD